MSADRLQWRMLAATQAEASSTLLPATAASGWRATVFGKVSKGMEHVDAFKGRDKMEKVEIVEV